VGLKVTVIEQLAPATRELPQLLVCAKSPVVLMLVIISVSVPVFVSETFWGALMLPTS
jgi:hypothetical protein